MSRRRLNRARLAAVPRLLDGYLESGRLPGYACLISQGGEEIDCYMGGLRDVERNQPTTRDTVYRIYSMTKPLTSVAVMQLFEQGALQLDDPIADTMPGWADVEVYRDGQKVNEGTHPPLLTDALERPITIKDLLIHTAGLTYGFQNAHAVDALYREHQIDASLNRFTAAEMLERLVRLPLQFQPGSRWNYSVATDVLGHLVEIISGQTLDAYLDEHVTGPLGMGETGFWARPDQHDRFAACYLAEPEQGTDKPQFSLQDDPAESPFLRPAKFFSGGGGLVSTIDDYHRFCRAMLGQGTLDDARILGSHSVDTMIRNHLPGGVDLTAMGQSRFSETPQDGIGFGLGFAVVVDSTATPTLCSKGEYGWGGMASTTFWIDPAEEIIVIFMTQLIPSSTWPIRHQLRDAVYQALVNP